MTNQVIPAQAVEAAAKAAGLVFDEPANSRDIEYIRTILEAAAPHMLIHVHHHDIEKHAESFNEGYETAMAQELADDPTTAQDWLDKKLAAAWEAGHTAGLRREFEIIAHMKAGEPTPEEAPNPYGATK